MEVKYFEFVKDTQVDVTPVVSVYFVKGEHLYGIPQEKSPTIAVRLSLNAGDFAGIRVEGNSFLLVLVPKENVKEIEGGLGGANLFGKLTGSDVGEI